MKAWRRVGCTGLLLLLLTGCGGSEENEAATPEGVDRQAEPPPAPSAVVEQVEPDRAPAVEPFGEAVVIDLGASLRSDRRLMVEGATNLPDATRLQVLVERELSGVRWQQRIDVLAGRFSAGPFGPGSGLPDGGYRITVNMPAVSIQPAEVRARLGEEGEHLQGPLVQASRHGLGRVVSVSQRFLVGSQPRRTTDQVEVMEVE